MFIGQDLIYNVITRTMYNFSRVVSVSLTADKTWFLYSSLSSLLIQWYNLSIASLNLHDYHQNKKKKKLYNITKEITPLNTIYISKMTTLHAVISICSKIQQNWYFSLRFQNSIYLNNMWCSRSILDQCRVVSMQLHIGCLSGYNTGCSTCNNSNCTRFHNNL